MRIAIPVEKGKMAEHFGHCDGLELFDVDVNSESIISEETLDAPEHEPGLLPRLIAENAVDVVIACGMGGRAQAFLSNCNIQVVTGVTKKEPKTIIDGYMAGTLEAERNACEHL